VTAYAYLEGVGLEAESSYPYVSGQSGAGNACSYNASAVVAKISGFVYATPGCTDTCPKQDEDKLAASLYESGPVSICVDASVWQTYTGGVLTSAAGCASAYTSLDHCVELTGWGVDATSNQKY